MVARIIRTVVAAALLTGACFAQKLDVDLAPERVVKDRLDSGLVGHQQREAAIRSLFAGVGCPVAEQPIDKIAANVICTLPGQTNSTIVVGGHFDFVDHGSGIVDDWSGTSLLPSLYQALKSRPRRHTYLFVAFAGEEDGLVGSKQYVRSLTSEQKSLTRAFINLECLGLSPMKVWTHRSTPFLVEGLNAAAKALDVTVQGFDVDDLGDDDTHPFLTAHIPVISIHSVNRENFEILHSDRDQVDAIHFDDYYTAYKVVANYLASLDGETGHIDPDGLLRLARAKMVENLEKLPKYTCVQTVHRARFEVFYGKARGCGHPQEVNPAVRGSLEMLAWRDQFKLDVTVSKGAEIFSWAGAQAFQSADVQEIVGGGLTGTGDFGPFLGDIFGGAGKAYQYLGTEADQGQTYAVYHYQVPAANSHYQIKVGSRPEDLATLAYEGQFWIDPRNAELSRMTIVVPKPPKEAETCRIETAIDYQRVPIEGARLLLPQSTLLKLWDADGGRYENRIAYAACRAFQSESVFRPEVEAGGGNSAGTATAAGASPAAKRVAIPPGLTVEIALRSKIDAETSFAGDAIEGQLLRAMETRDGVLLAPEGAMVRGRIVRFVEHSQPSHYFAVGLKFQALALKGGDVPLALEAAPRSREEQLLNGSAERRQGIGMFLFQGDRLTLDERFVSEWKTGR